MLSTETLKPAAKKTAWWDEKANKYQYTDKAEAEKAMDAAAKAKRRKFLMEFQPYTYRSAKENLVDERFDLVQEIIKEKGWEQPYYDIPASTWKSKSSYIWAEWRINSMIDYHDRRFEIAKNLWLADQAAKEKYKDYVPTNEDKAQLLFELGSIYRFDKIKSVSQDYSIISMCACCGTIGVKPSKNDVDPTSDLGIYPNVGTKKIIWSADKRSRFYMENVKQFNREELHIQDDEGNNVYISIVKEEE